jgi:hypothetical protein
MRVSGVLVGGFVVAVEFGIGVVFPVAHDVDGVPEPHVADLGEQHLLVAGEQIAPVGAVGACEQVDVVQREFAG